VNEILEPLARTPGVRFVGLVTTDGVPIAVPGRAASLAPGEDEHDVTALAAIATAWLDEVTRMVGALSWDAPRRLVMRAARGTLVLLGTRGAVLAALLDSGVGPEELRVAMDGAVARIQRTVRGMGRDDADSTQPRHGSEPRSALPLGNAGGPGAVTARREDTHHQAGT
jgi:predicted regulator of Ras-like GTPase activity (Roadblock/LC7/MglB family)